MKPLHAFGVAFALLLTSATTVLAADQPTPTADILRGPYYGPTQEVIAEATMGATSVPVPGVADILRNPYFEPTQVAPAVADVLREGYEVVWPRMAVDPN